MRQGQLYPDYVCQKRKVEYAGPSCQHIPGRYIDEAMADLVLGSMTEVNLEMAMAVQEEVVSRQEEARALRAQQVARVEYEAELAGQRYRKVDPNNRLVAETLEAEWNEALGRLQEAQREYARHEETDRMKLDEGMRAQIKALTSDFPRVWHTASDRDRKRLLHLLVEDVTLLKQKEVTVYVRFRGGATQTLRLPASLSAWELRQTPAEVVAAIDELLNEYTEVQIADILTERGLSHRSGDCLSGVLGSQSAANLWLDEPLPASAGCGPAHDAKRWPHGWPSPQQPSKSGGKRGFCAAIPTTTKVVACTNHPMRMHLARSQGRKLSQRRRFPKSKLMPNRAQEVQCEA